MRVTDQERLFIIRRRAGWTQRQMAAQLGVTVRDYLVAETSYAVRGWLLAHGVDVTQLRGVREHERCTILRRRAGLTQAQLAKKIKRCRRWVTLMELGLVPVAELRSYWGRRHGRA